jgi:dethiobiotin synthetase
MSTWFITGTDTEIGKTWCSLAFIKTLQKNNASVAVMKPIASGCKLTSQGIRNSDAEQLIKQSGLDLDYNLVNPYAFIPPIAPHLAANLVNKTIKIDKIVTAKKILQKKYQHLVIEGVGGWRVPLNNQESLVDLVNALDAQVILVVGLRLGCINHALLTAETIINDGCKLYGWIANSINNNFNAQDSIQTIKERLDTKFLGHVDYNFQSLF